MNPAGIQVSTPTDTTIVLTRAFHAARRLVWEAMFVPDQMRRWMLAPPGWAMIACECDAREGGALRLAWKNPEDHSVMTIHGTFTEAVPHERIVHTETMEMGSGQTVGSLLEAHEFTESGGITTMRITQTYDSKEARDATLATGVEQCMEPGYQQLDALLAQRA